jgi:hypothetical protein
MDVFSSSLACCESMSKNGIFKPDENQVCARARALVCVSVVHAVFWRDGGLVAPKQPRRGRFGAIASILSRESVKIADFYTMYALCDLATPNDTIWRRTSRVTSFLHH